MKYPPVLWQQETKEATLARFAEALKPDHHPGDPSPALDRKHIFDLYCGVRMIVSMDVEEDYGRSLHFSFGLPPHSGIDPTLLENMARPLITELWHLPVVVEEGWSSNAYHVWCQPD